MNVKLKNIIAGLLFTVVGLFFLFQAQNYKMGDLKKMGPAYFPTLVAILLVIVGTVVLFRALRDADVVKFSSIQVRPVIFVALANVAFGFIITTQLGFVVAVFCLIMLANMANNHFRPVEAFGIFIVLTIVTYFLFFNFLHLPIQFLPWIF